MMKYLNNEERQKLLELINQIKTERETPTDLRVGIIIPIFNKSRNKECKNYRGISLISTVGKVYARILQDRLGNKIEEQMRESQIGFRKGRGIHGQIFILKQLNEEVLVTKRQIHICFIDLKMAFDRVRREDVWRILEKRGIDMNLIENVKSLYKDNKSYVRPGTKIQRRSQINHG